MKTTEQFEQAKKRNNPNGVAVGDVVLLDGDYANHSSVKVIALTPQEMFATVKCENKIWEVMTRRLSKI